MRVSDFWAIHVGKFPKPGPGRPRGLHRAWKKSNHGQDYHPYGRVQEDAPPGPGTGEGPRTTID